MKNRQSTKVTGEIVTEEKVTKEVTKEILNLLTSKTANLVPRLHLTCFKILTKIPALSHLLFNANEYQNNQMIPNPDIQSP